VFFISFFQKDITYKQIYKRMALYEIHKENIYCLFSGLEASSSALLIRGCLHVKETTHCSLLPCVAV
jgi:hypothetical protein